MKLRPILLLLALVLLILPACMKSASYGTAGYAYEAEEGRYAPAMAPPPPPSPKPSAPGRADRSFKMSVKGERDGVAADAAAEAEPSPEGPAPANESPVAARMVHYDGWARMRVTRTEDLVQEVSRIATEEGGQVESANPTRVTVRVPVARFEAVFARILTLGDVLDKSISAVDVTEAFTAVDLRLRTARATRERLQALLARAKDEEKLEILKQIQRLTEEIDLLDSQLRMISTLASFSSITVEAVSRQAVSQRSVREDIAGLAWIQSLSPFKRDVAFGGDMLRLDAPEGFLVLNDKRHFVAESADGAVLWTAILDNVPEGDSAFWIEAVRQRLAPEFGPASVSSLGGFEILRLEDSAENPYVYLVALRVVGRELQLVEVYYPSREQEQRYKIAIDSVLVGRIG